MTAADVICLTRSLWIVMERKVIGMSDVFLLNESEKELVEFIGQYQYLLMKDVPYFIKSTYYRTRLQRLIKSKVIRKYKKYLALSINGRAYMESIGKPVSIKTEYRQKQINRIEFTSHFAAMFHNNKTVTFTPSTQLKDKMEYTEKSLRFIRSN